MGNNDRLKRQLALVQHARDNLLTYLRGAFEFREGMSCTKCRQPALRLLKFHTPRLTTKILDPEIGSITLAVIMGTFYLIDGHCDFKDEKNGQECGNDLHALFARIDPELELDPELAKHSPEFRDVQKCSACQELGLRGYFRGNVCTGGICLNCGVLLGPRLIVEAFQDAMKNVIEWITELRTREQNLQLCITSEPDAPQTDESGEIRLEHFDEEITIKDYEDS